MPPYAYKMEGLKIYTGEYVLSLCAIMLVCLTPTWKMFAAVTMPILINAAKKSSLNHQIGTLLAAAIKPPCQERQNEKSTRHDK